MSKQVPWNEEIYRNFCDLAMLSAKEKEVLRMRIMNYSVTETSMSLHISESSVARIVKRLKVKYDKVQPLSEGKLPPRKYSAKETWMDTH